MDRSIGKWMFWRVADGGWVGAWACGYVGMWVTWVYDDRDGVIVIGNRGKFTVIVIVIDRKKM